MLTVLLVFLGSAIGGVLRYGLSNAIQTRMGGRFPVGTLVVNVSGCLLIGALWGWMTGSSDLMADDSRAPALTFQAAGAPLQFLALGLLGGYTTVSSFGLQTFEFLKDRRYLMALVYPLTTWLLCLFAAYAGFRLLTA